MINVGNIQVREGASIPKAQHGTMTKGLAPAEYNIGIDPLVGPWESLSDLEAYMISSGRKDKQGNPLFINGQETTIVGSDGIPHKYIRSNGAWLAMTYSGGAVAYASDVYDEAAGKNQATLNAEFASGIANAGISDVQVKSASASNYTTIVAGGIAKIDLSGFVSQADGGGTALTTSEHRSGSYSEAISLPRAIGLGSVSSGDDCIAFGKASTAIGCNTIAIGDNSFVAGRNGFNYSEFPVFNRATYLQDGYIGIAYSGPYEVTRGMVMVFRDENYQISEYEPITNVEYGPYDGANTNWSGRDCLKLYYDTSHTIDVPTYLEVSTASLGRNSIGLGYNTVAANEGEVAVGCCNITHGGQTNAEKTMFSVGIGVDKILDYTQDHVFRNAFEVMWDGSIYVKGVGEYDGRELTGKTDLATVITNINTRLQTLEGATVGGGSSNNVAAEDVSYNASTAYTSGNVGYEIKQIETDLSTRLGGIKSTGHAEDNSGAAIGHSSHALAYRGRQRMYDVANQEWLNVIYTNAGTVSVGETTCAIGEFSFAAGQGNNGGGNAPDYYYHVASSYEAGDEYIYLQEEPVGQYLSFKESPYDEPSGDHVAKIVSKSYDGYVWEVRLAEPYIDRNINADNWVYPITGSHGQNSSSFGMHTIAQGDDSTVVGKYNYPMSNELFSVGCGTGQPASARKNALIVLDDGSIYIKGVGNYDGTNAGESGVLSLQDMLSSLGFGNTGNSSGSDPYGSDPYASDPYASDPYASDPYGSDPYGSDPYESDPYGSDPYGGGY